MSRVLHVERADFDCAWDIAASMEIRGEQYRCAVRVNDYDNSETVADKLRRLYECIANSELSP